MPETTPLIKAALNLRGGAGFDVYVLTTAVPNVFPVRNPISVLNVTLSDGTLYADAVPCAMLSARISKKKPVNVF